MADLLLTFSTHDALLLAHVLGLIIGFGVAISIDYLLLRALLQKRLSPITLDIAEHAARLTMIGLGILWLSGIGFLLEYNSVSPEKLLNPKIHAKIVIVCLLTLNGYLIHRFVMPILWHHTGRDVLALLPAKSLFLFAFLSVVSTVSWIFPLIFGLNSALNFNYSASTLLAYYAITVMGAFSVAGLFLSTWRRHSSEKSRFRSTA